jgi:inosose dehydratase
MKAVKIAAATGVKHVITSEGDPKTEFGKNLSTSEAIFSIREKLYEPLRMAADYGVKILIEPHGHISDSVDLMEEVIDKCNSEALGVNLDTGNLWLGGGDSLEMIKRLGSKIEHVHWKDLLGEFEDKRGTIFGCGMSTIALGKGVIDIEAIYNALVAAGFDGYSTLEIAGEDAVKESYEFLKKLGAI